MSCFPLFSSSSPPLTTSLPCHDHQDQDQPLLPPPTDGPNTRDRLKRGLIPKSGRRNDDGEMIELEGGYLYNGWNDEGTIMMSSDIEVGRQQQHHQYLDYLDQGTDLSFPSTSASTSTSPNWLRDELGNSNNNLDYSDLFNYNPPPPPPRATSLSSSSSSSYYNNDPFITNNHEKSQQQEQEPDGLARFLLFPPPQQKQKEQRRFFSNATIIEYDPSMISTTSRREEERVEKEKESSSSNGLGITREEWLRLGGFFEEEHSRKEEEEEEEEVFNPPPRNIKINQENPSSLAPPIFNLPPPPFPSLPLPPGNSTTSYHSTFILPPNPFPQPRRKSFEILLPPTPIEDSVHQNHHHHHEDPNFNLPNPPPQFKQQRPSNNNNNNDTSPLKSPRKKLNIRSNPYPTIPFNSFPLSQVQVEPDDIKVPTTTTTEQSLTTLGAGGGGGDRNLTPTSSLVFKSVQSSLLLPKPKPSLLLSTQTNDNDNIPSSLSSSPEKGITLTTETIKKKKKKSHGRKVSIGHIPRPRNPFILFRSHIVNSGLLPKKSIKTIKNPSGGTGGQEEISIVVEEGKPLDHKNVSKIVGEIWRGLKKEEKREWEELAKEEKRLHKELYPDYRYKPKMRTSRSSKSSRPGTGNSSNSSNRKNRFDRDEEEDLIVNQQQQQEDQNFNFNLSSGGGFGDILVDSSLPMTVSPCSIMMMNQPSSSSSSGRRRRRRLSNDSSSSVSSSPLFFQNVTPTQSSNIITPTKGGNLEPTFSNSQTPPRHHYSSSPSKHPLSQSQSSNLEFVSDEDGGGSPSKRQKKSTSYYGEISLMKPSSSSLLFPTIPTPPSLPLEPSPFKLQQQQEFQEGRGGTLPNHFNNTFTTDSRQFSLGRWELKKPSNSTTSTQGLMERSLLALNSISSEGGGGGVGDQKKKEGERERERERVSSSLVLDPRQFLNDLIDQDDKEEEEEEESLSIWDRDEDDNCSISTFSTNPTTLSSNSNSNSNWSSSSSSVPPVPPIFDPFNNSYRNNDNSNLQTPFQQRGHQQQQERKDSSLFHFGSKDLFEKPRNALTGRLRSTESITDAGTGKGIGFGINLGNNSWNSYAKGGGGGGDGEESSVVQK